MIHFPLVLSAGPAQQGGAFPFPVPPMPRNPPRTHIEPHRRPYAWNRLDGPVPVRGTAQGTCVPAVPSRPHGGTFCKQNL